MKRILKVLLVTGFSLAALLLVGVGGLYWYSRLTIQNSVKELKLAVTRDFNDPESAQFRNIELQSMAGTISGRLKEFDVELLKKHSFEYLKAVLTYDPNMFQLCGEVNAKNAFGAYVGYKAFWINSLGGIDEANTFIATRDGDDFPKRMCEIGDDEFVVYTEK